MFYLVIQRTGIPPDATGVIPTISFITFVSLAGLLMFLEIMILGATLSLSIWRSAAITWVTSNSEEKITPSDIQLLRRAAAIPYRNVQIGISPLALALVLAIVSLPIGKTLITSPELELVDWILVMTWVSLGFNILIEYSHMRLETKYSQLPEAQLVQTLTIANPVRVPFSGIIDVLDSPAPEKNPRIYLMVLVLLVILWSMSVIILSGLLQ